MSKQFEKLQVLGKVTGFYGVKGWVKLYSYTDPRESIVQYSALKIKLKRQDKKQHNKSTPPLIIAHDGNLSGRNREQWQDIKLDSGKAHGKGVVAHFSGYDTREAAAILIGAEVAVYRSDFKATVKDEYYWADLVGLDVVNLEGIALGRVSRLMETAANDVLVIKSAQHESDANSIDEILIPFAMPHYVKRVDLQAGIIEVDWPSDWNKETTNRQDN